jgi:hypothetical protein
MPDKFSAGDGLAFCLDFSSKTGLICGLLRSFESVPKWVDRGGGWR